MLPMVLDGILSYLGITGTTNTIRLLTGAAFGIPIPLLLVPAANFNINGANELSSIGHWWEPPLIYTAAGILCALLILGSVPYIIACIIILSGFLFLVYRLIYTIIARALHLTKARLYAAASGGTIIVLASMYTVSALVLQPLRALITGG